MQMFLLTSFNVVTTMYMGNVMCVTHLLLIKSNHLFLMNKVEWTSSLISEFHSVICLSKELDIKESIPLDMDGAGH